MESLAYLYLVLASEVSEPRLTSWERGDGSQAAWKFALAGVLLGSAWSAGIRETAAASPPNEPWEDAEAELVIAEIVVDPFDPAESSEIEAPGSPTNFEMPAALPEAIETTAQSEGQRKSPQARSRASLTLTRGDRGKSVEQLQQKLEKLGYYNGPITQYFGELTESAVMEFQADWGLAADGVVGSNTRAALSGSFRTSTSAPAAAAPAEVVSLEPNVPDAGRSTSSERSTARSLEAAVESAIASSPAEVLREGDSGEEVTEVQQLLQQLGYWNAKTYGYFGLITQEAVMAFQRDRNLSTNGRVTPELLEAMRAAANEPSAEAAPEFSTPTNGVLAKGSYGEEVTRLQQALERSGYWNATAYGYFGPITEAAVRSFQRDRGLQVDGKAGPATLAALDRAPVRRMATATATSILRKGATGEEVSAVQKALRDVGFYTSEAHGNFDEATENAVKAFQQRRGLQVDGIVGPQTSSALLPK